MPDTKAPPKKTYFQTFLNRPNETSQEIQTFEGIFKNSVEGFGALARLRQQGGKLFQSGNLFTGLTEMSKLAIAFSPTNLFGINNILGPISKFIPSGLFSLILMGGIGAWTYFDYAKPNQKNALPPNYPSVTTPVVTNPATTPVGTPIPGSPNCTVTVVGGVPKVTCTTTSTTPTAPSNTPTTPTNGNTGTGNTNPSNTSTGNTTPATGTTTCRTVIVGGKPQVVCTTTSNLTTGNRVVQPANFTEEIGPVQVVGESDPTRYTQLTYEKGDDYAAVWNGRNPRSIALGEMVADGLSVHQ